MGLNRFRNFLIFPSPLDGDLDCGEVADPDGEGLSLFGPNNFLPSVLLGDVDDADIPLFPAMEVMTVCLSLSCQVVCRD